MNEFNQQNQQPDQNQTNETTPVYLWDGKHHSKKRRRRRRPVMFFSIAAVCILLTALICVPTVLYATDSDHFATSSGTASDGNESVSGNAGVDGDQSYEVSQTVTITDQPYTESSTLTELYAKCQVSCVTVYVTFRNGYGLGSGFVLTEDGYIATNQHVVEDGTSIKVIFYDGTEYDAELVGEDATRNLAVLKINAKNLTPLPIGDSDALVVGQTAVAIGTPYDLELAGTMTMGIISGLQREFPIYNDNGTMIKTMKLIQTDTPINPGNSGGPLINMAGQVVGINNLKLVDEYEGVGFAIPINSAVEIFNQLIQYGKVVQDPEAEFVSSTPRLGIEVYELSAGLSTFKIVPTCEYPQQGVLVSTVDPNSAVYKAGLGRFDIIVEFDGKAITSLNDVTDVLSGRKAGESVTMKVFTFNRDFSSGEYKEFTFVLDSAEALS